MSEEKFISDGIKKSLKDGLKKAKEKAIGVGELGLAGIMYADDLLPFLGIWDDILAVGLTVDGLRRLGKSQSCESYKNKIMEVARKIKLLEKIGNTQKAKEEKEALKKELLNEVRKYDECNIRLL